MSSRKCSIESLEVFSVQPPAAEKPKRALARALTTTNLPSAAEMAKDEKFIELQIRQLEYGESSLKRKRENFEKRFINYISEKKDLILKEKAAEEMSQKATKINQSIEDRENAIKEKQSEIEVAKAEIASEKQNIAQQVIQIQEEARKLEEEREKFMQSIQEREHNPKSDAALLKYDRELLTDQRKKFLSDRDVFQETQRKFEERFAQYIIEKGKADDKLQIDQKDIELLKSSLLRRQSDIDTKEKELKESREQLEADRAIFEKAWSQLEEQVQRLTEARNQILKDRTEIEVSKKEIELQNEKAQSLKEPLKNLESVFSSVCGSMELPKIRTFINGSEEKALTSIDQVYEYFRASQISAKKTISGLTAKCAQLEDSDHRERLLLQKKLSEMARELSEAHHTVDECGEETAIAIRQKEEAEESLHHQVVKNGNLKLKVAELTEKIAKEETAMQRQTIENGLLRDSLSKVSKEKDVKQSRELISLEKSLREEFQARLNAAIEEERRKVNEEVAAKYKRKKKKWLNLIAQQRKAQSLQQKPPNPND